GIAPSMGSQVAPPEMGLAEGIPVKLHFTLHAESKLPSGSSTCDFDGSADAMLFAHIDGDGDRFAALRDPAAHYSMFKIEPLMAKNPRSLPTPIASGGGKGRRHDEVNSCHEDWEGSMAPGSATALFQTVGEDKM